MRGSVCVCKIVCGRRRKEAKKDSVEKGLMDNVSVSVNEVVVVGGLAISDPRLG